MRKFLSIVFALLILVAGMRPTVSTHYCAGNIAAVKWSFSGEQAGCGMISDMHESFAGTVLASACCHNENAVYAVDSNYSPSSCHFDAAPSFSSLTYLIPANIMALARVDHSVAFIGESPPGDVSSGSFSLAGLCTFRI